MSYQYLIVDSRGKAVANCHSRDSLHLPTWHLEIDKGDLGNVLTHEYIHVVGLDEAAEGSIDRVENGIVVVKAVREIDGQVRQNLRMPVKFESFLYHTGLGGTGRAPILSNDLSCGGVGFYCGAELPIGSTWDVVIPVTEAPLILTVEILRKRPTIQPIPLYGTRFVDLLYEEETMLREAVFHIQLQESEDEIGE